MYTLNVISEVSPDHFLPHIQSMVFLFSNTLNSVEDLGSPLAYYTILTMDHFIPVAAGDQAVNHIFMQ
jgi:hypothetical protein